MMKRIQKYVFFCLIPKRHADLYKTFRSLLTTELSLIFCRLAISGESKIRFHEIQNLGTVQKVLGLDVNSLYLHAIAQNNPTDYFYRCKEEKDFRPDPCSKFGYQSYQWFGYVAFQKNTSLQTRLNMGESRVSIYVVCQWTVILSSKTPRIHFFVVFSTLAHKPISTRHEMHPLKNSP